MRRDTAAGRYSGGRFRCERPHQPAGEGGGGEPPILPGRDRRAHGLYLLLHKTIDVSQQRVVDWAALEGLGAGKLTVDDETAGRSFDVRCALTDREREILLAGGRLAHTRAARPGAPSR